MTTADEKLVQVIEKAFEARITLGQPPVSSTLPTSRQRLPTQLDYVSVNDVIRIVKPYFKEETTFESWISSLACEVSEEGQASIAGNIGLADILNNVNERIFLKFPSVLSLLEHPKTLHRAVGETTPCAIKTPNGIQFDYLIQINDSDNPAYKKDYIKEKKTTSIWSCQKCGYLRKQLAYLIDVRGSLLDSGCFSDGCWNPVKVLSVDENSGMATIEQLAPDDGKTQTEVISSDRLRPIDRKTTGIPYYAEIFNTKNGVMSHPVTKSKTWEDIMPLQRRVLKLAAFGKQTIIQVPAIEPKTESDNSFPGVHFLENGSMIIDNYPESHAEQSYKPAQSPQGPLIPEEYYLKLFSIWDGSSLASMIASMKLCRMLRGCHPDLL
jgi:hypothetical protein